MAVEPPSETPPVDPEQLPGLLAAVPFWKLREDGKALTRSFTAKNFMAGEQIHRNNCCLTQICAGVVC